MIRRLAASAALLLGAFAILPACAPTRTIVHQDRNAALAFSCVVVTPFENVSRARGAGLVFADALGDALLAHARFSVVERTEVQRYLATRPDFSLSPDPVAAAEIGRALQADAVIVGSVSEFGYRPGDGRPELTVSLRIVDVRTGRVVYAANGSYAPEPLREGPSLLSASAFYVAGELVSPMVLLGDRPAAPGACGTPGLVPLAPAVVASSETSPADEAIAEPVAGPEPVSDATAADTPTVSDDVAGPADEPTVLSPAVQAFLDRLQGENFVLEAVDFELDKTSFKNEDYRSVLENLGRALQAAPDVRVSIDAHTDSMGDAETNMQLTQQRAEIIRDHLVREFGLDPSRFEVRGYGGERPLLPNINRKNREKNRRVEITVLKGP